MTNPQASPSEQFNELLGTPYPNANVQLCLAAVDKAVDKPDFRKVQLSPEVATQFTLIVTRQMELFARRAARGDLRLLKYNAGAMNRSDEVEYLSANDESGIWEQFDALDSVSSLPIFKAQEDFVSRLHFYVITVDFGDERALFFRFYAPQNELSHSSFLGVRLSKTVFNLVRDPTFLFDLHLDCAVYRDVLYIFNKNNFQRIFRYYERMRDAGREALRTISDRVRIDNFAAFASLCEGRLNMLAKLKNIAAKEYLQRVTMQDIKRVIVEFNLPAKMEGAEGEERLVFEPDAEDKWLILRILDDDYLGSIMTELKYEANSKRPVDVKGG